MSLFRRNFSQYGNIYGFEAELFSDMWASPNDVSRVCLFYGMDTIICGAEALILEYLIENNIRKPSAEDITDAIEMTRGSKRFRDSCMRYLDLVRPGISLAREIDSSVGVFFSDISHIYLMYSFGYRREALAKGRKILETITNGRIEKIIVYSPKDFLTLRILFDHFNINIQLTHLFEFIEPKIREIFAPDRPISFAVQESCVLSRELGKHDILNILEKIPNLTILKPTLSGKLTVCCGDHMWLFDPIVTINNVSVRLESLMRLGTHMIGTMCPTALCLFQTARNRGGERFHNVEIVDLSRFLASLLRS